MSSVEWVEVRGKDVDVAVAAALEELGLDGRDAADIEVLQAPERGFLGMGGKDAIVRVKPKQKSGRRRRRGGRGKGSGSTGGGKGASKERSGAAKKAGGSSNGGKKRQQKAASDSSRSRQRPPRQPRQRSEERPSKKEPKEPKVDVEVDRAEQAAMVKEFLTGLLEAFGIEGVVECTVDDDIILADVSGEQTEALVGHKGAILQATLELSRTIVQRKSQAGARIRLDIAGYTERRREALRIYTGRLVAKVLEEGGEIMLEPMNAADRKVVHDAAGELGGVKTYSEGEEPRRSVVIAKIEE